MEFLKSVDSMWRNHKFLTILVYSVVGGVLLTAVASNKNISLNTSYIILFIYVALLPGLAFAIMGCKSKASKNISYLSSGLISVKKRESVNSFLFKIDRHYETQHQYVPASATFTAVSVGGVTTGGWDVKPEHYKEQFAGNTDKYLLHYSNTSNNSCYVSTIYLDDESIASAKKDPYLSPLLDGEKLILQHKIVSQKAQSALNQYGKDSNYHNYMNNVQSEITKTLLNEYEMNRVLSFLCGS